MYQRTFQYATRGHCIKGKQCHRVTLEKNRNFFMFNTIQAYFPFMRWPLVSNR